MRTNFRILTVVCTMTAALTASALADEAHTRCDRSVRFAGLSEQTKAALYKGETVTISDENTDTVFHMNVIMRLVDLDAELVQAVMTAYDEQKDHLKSLKESTVEELKGNTARIRYIADTGHWYVPNSHYTVNDVATKDGATYLLDWSLAHSEGLTKLSYIDGYMRTEPVGAHALVLYCNYVIPDIQMAPDQVNREGLEALQGTVSQLVTWVTEVSHDQGRANKYLERYRSMLGF
jgi:hypothetical protein